MAIQYSFPTLLILLSVQSCVSSGTVALASAIAADIIIPAERGAYMGISSLGNILDPSLDLIAGGLLSKYLGWQALFWFLTILASAVFFFFWSSFRRHVGLLLMTVHCLLRGGIAQFGSLFLLEYRDSSEVMIKKSPLIPIDPVRLGQFQTLGHLSDYSLVARLA